MNLKGRKFENKRLNMEIFVYEIKDKEYFIGKDVAELLGYNNPSTAVSENVKPNQKLKMYAKTIENIETSEITNSEIVVNNNISFITEIGLYQLVMKSRRKEAEEFQEWVYGEVLPSIRKNSYYVDRENINQEQINKLKEYLFGLCEDGKISLGKASLRIFGDEKELKKRLINLGLLDYDKCSVNQIKSKASNGKKYDLFCYNVSGTYSQGIVKEQLQVSLANAGYVYLKDLFEKDKNKGMVDV